MAIIISILYILVALIVATSVAGVIYGVGALVRKNKEATISNIKWIACCALVVAITLGMIYFSIPAKAEDESGFYYKAVFVDEIEDYSNKEYLLHTDDLDHLWNYWEDKEETFSDFNWDLEKLALLFITENNLDAVIDTETCICRGRIVILTMWECDEEDPFDDEVVDVYYSEFITW